MGKALVGRRTLTEACIAEYVAKYATKEQVDEAGEGSDDSDEMSSVGSYNDDEDDDDDVQPAGTMEV
jgi:ubiquitin-conjugating enzyme E2 H